MGDSESRGANRPAAPCQYVEVQHPRAPAAARPTPEVLLDGLEGGEKRHRLERAFDQRDGIGEIATRAALGGVEQDRRGIVQAEFPIQPRDCCPDHLRGPAVVAVRSIGPERDGVEVRCI